MSARAGTNVARFVRSAWALLAFQLIASAAAAALAFWAVIEVRGLVGERDALAARVAELEAARPGPPAAAPAPLPQAPPAAAPLPEAPRAAAPPSVPSVATRDAATADPVRAPRPEQRPRVAPEQRPRVTPDAPPGVTPDERRLETRPRDGNVSAPIDRPKQPGTREPVPKAATSFR